MDSIPGLGRSSGREHGDPLQGSCLRNPTDRGAWQATVHGVAKRWTRLKQLSTAQSPHRISLYPILQLPMDPQNSHHVTMWLPPQFNSRYQMDLRVWPSFFCCLGFLWIWMNNLGQIFNNNSFLSDMCILFPPSLLRAFSPSPLGPRWRLCTTLSLPMGPKSDDPSDPMLLLVRSPNTYITNPWQDAQWVFL